VSNDLLSDVLSLVHLTGALIFELDITGGWSIASNPTIEKFVPLLRPGTTNVITFHVVLEGECWVRFPSADWTAVPMGHAVVITHNQPHELCDRPGRKTVPFETVLGECSLQDVRRVRFDLGDGGTTRLLCGFLGCDRRAFDPLCASLPALFQVDLGERMQTLLPYAIANALDDSPGAAALRGHVAELLYLGAVRLYMRGLPQDASGWLAGLRDPVIGRALQALHAQPARHWSVGDLAAVAASSRSVIAARFAQMLGETPMHYLTRLRMSLAARQLTDSHKSIAAIADEVGYGSPAAFQHAFRRDFNMPPAAWRKNAAGGAQRSVDSR
jgi:AraC-like DNA-binding protein